MRIDYRLYSTETEQNKTIRRSTSDKVINESKYLFKNPFIKIFKKHIVLPPGHLPSSLSHRPHQAPPRGLSLPPPLHQPVDGEATLIWNATRIFEGQQIFKAMVEKAKEETGQDPMVIITKDYGFGEGDPLRQQL